MLTCLRDEERRGQTGSLATRTGLIGSNNSVSHPGKACYQVGVNLRLTTLSWNGLEQRYLTTLPQFEPRKLTPSAERRWEQLGSEVMGMEPCITRGKGFLSLIATSWGLLSSEQTE